MTEEHTPVQAPAPPMPAYRGEPLDPDRGPGLGCFWIQIITLGILLVATPLSVYMGAPDWVSAAMLIITLVLLLFAAQTVIFLLRLVAADRRTRRRPMSDSARKTVGMMEDGATSLGADHRDGEGQGDEPEGVGDDADGDDERATIASPEQ